VKCSDRATVRNLKKKKKVLVGRGGLSREGERGGRRDSLGEKRIRDWNGERRDYANRAIAKKGIFASVEGGREENFTFNGVS